MELSISFKYAHVENSMSGHYNSIYTCTCKLIIMSLFTISSLAEIVRTLNGEFSVKNLYWMIYSHYDFCLSVIRILPVKCCKIKSIHRRLGPLSTENHIIVTVTSDHIKLTSTDHQIKRNAKRRVRSGDQSAPVN